jgi:Inner membrane component of T3SS, cytoplasmic domain
MHRNTDQRIDASQPALIVTYGNTERKHRPLDRDVILIGQARVCEIRLAAPEIADVHCVVFRAAAGWMVRDCGSRAGTRIDGRPVHQTQLHDEDVLQVGTFTFRVHLPQAAGAEAAAGAAYREQRLERSRRRLALRALRLRRKLREERATRPAPAAGADEGLARQAEVLRDRLRECEQRAAKLQQAERDVARDRAALEREAAEFKDRVTQVEKLLASRMARYEEQRAEQEQALRAPPAPACDSAIF